MVHDIELMAHKPHAVPKFGCVVHVLKFYPSLEPVLDGYQRPVSISGMIARELVSYLNSNAEFDAFTYQGSMAGSKTASIAYKNRKLITVKQKSLFKISLVVSINHPRINRYVEDFFKTNYPIRHSVWVEVS
ncbi:MAG: hypothetical protein ACE5FT_04130 [Candidatus Nanoarchaeia archaeon]